MMSCHMGKQGLQGMLLMAACCGAPLLLFLLLPFVGSVLGVFGVSALNTLALLACPIGMGLMMWMMMRAQQAGGPPASQRQAPLETNTIPEQRQRALFDLSAAGDATEQAVPLAWESNGHQAAAPIPTVHSQEVPTQPLGENAVIPLSREKES